MDHVRPRVVIAFGGGFQVGCEGKHQQRLAIRVLLLGAGIEPERPLDQPLPHLGAGSLAVNVGATP